MYDKSKKVVLFVVFLVLVGVALVFAFRYSKRLGYEQAAHLKVDELFDVKNELKFGDVEFKPQIDYDGFVDLLGKINSDKGGEYSEPFKQYVKKANAEIFELVAESLNLEPSLKAEVQELYESRSEDLNESIYNQLLEENKSILDDNDEKVFKDSTYRCAENLEKVLSRNICSIAGYIFTLATAQDAGNGTVGTFWGKSCEFVLETALKPLAEKIKEKAIIKDYSHSIASLKKHLRDNILELATIEDQLEINWEQSYRRTLFNIPISESNLDMKVKSRVKAGFNLKNSFEVKFNHSKKTILLVLPEPEILTIELNHKIIEMKMGLLRKIGEDELNKVLQDIRNLTHNQAIRKGILEKARQNSQIVINTLISPILMETDYRYKIKVEFTRQTPSTPTDTDRIKGLKNPVLET